MHWYRVLIEDRSDEFEKIVDLQIFYFIEKTRFSSKLEYCLY